MPDPTKLTNEQLASRILILAADKGEWLSSTYWELRQLAPELARRVKNVESQP